VQELRTFIEESSVILVAFQNKMAALAEAKTAPEIFSDAADQEPLKHRSGCRLSMGSGDNDNFFA
jgi:hypothetical protein